MVTNLVLFKRDMQEVRYRSKTRCLFAGGPKWQTRREAGTQSLKSRFEFVGFIEFIGLQVLNPTDPKNSKNPTNQGSLAIETS
jgi:hypothetical protein